MNISCSRGDTAGWTLTAALDGDPIDLTGGSVIFAARRNPASAVVFERTSAIGGGITIAAGTGGVAEIKLKSDDTLQFSNQETHLFYTVHVFTAAGDEWCVVSGTLTVAPIAWDGTP